MSFTPEAWIDQFCADFRLAFLRLNFQGLSLFFDFDGGR